MSTAKQTTRFNVPEGGWTHWVKIRDGVDGKACGAVWTNGSGVIIEHCGHPTANFPYYVILPTGETVRREDGNVKTWARLRDAQAAVALLNLKKTN